jgi:hypothetical protein
LLFENCCYYLAKPFNWLLEILNSPYLNVDVKN